MTLSAADYRVIIQNGILAQAGDCISTFVKHCRVLLVSDTNVFPHYGGTVTDSLKAAGFSVTTHVLPAGEENKTLRSVEGILSSAAEAELTRDDVILALGGGVVGDLAGFTAAIYLRGIRYVSLPTTLLAMVDSSVGGKTGADLPCGKNLVGAFHSPSLVLTDPTVLTTLPKDEYASGMAEVIKMAMTGDGALFSALSSDSVNLSAVIERAVSYKLSLVSEDFTDRGTRQLLNFGHTVGHAIEILSDYRVKHGQAVAAGMVMMTKYAEENGVCEQGTAERLIALEEQYGLSPFLYRDYSRDDLYSAVLHDKKRRGDSYTVVLPESVGHARLCSLTPDGMKELLRKGVTL